MIFLVCVFVVVDDVDGVLTRDDDFLRAKWRETLLVGVWKVFAEAAAEDDFKYLLLDDVFTALVVVVVVAVEVLSAANLCMPFGGACVFCCFCGVEKTDRGTKKDQKIGETKKPGKKERKVFGTTKNLLLLMRNWIVSITSRIKICFLLPQHDRWLLDHHRLLLHLHHHLCSRSSIARHRSRGARKASTWRYVLLFIIVIINLPFFSSMSKTNSFSIKTNDFSSRRTTTLSSFPFFLSVVVCAHVLEHPSSRPRANFCSHSSSYTLT